jgi:putative component of membrane protein insertase Oxa1/YidC/SpoIIIJ protein YidD
MTSYQSNYRRSDRPPCKKSVKCCRHNKYNGHTRIFKILFTTNQKELLYKALEARFAPTCSNGSSYTLDKYTNLRVISFFAVQRAATCEPRVGFKGIEIFSKPKYKCSLYTPGNITYFRVYSNIFNCGSK